MCAMHGPLAASRVYCVAAERGPPQNRTMMPRRKAIVTHALVSLAVVSALLAIIFFVWYPYPFFRINGAANVLRTLVGVDLVLGPLLTVLLYKPGKKGLWIDMWFIAIVQLSALVYGTSVIYQERPQYLVFSVDRFVLLPAGDLAHDGSPIDACADSQAPPCTAVAVVPNDVETRNELLRLSLEDGIELEQQPTYWRSLEAGRETVLEHAGRLPALARRTPAAAAGVDAVLRRQSVDADALRWVPIVNKRLDGFCLIVDAQTLEAVDVIALDPWALPPAPAAAASDGADTIG